MISVFYLMLALVGLAGAGVTFWKSDHKADLLILYAFAAGVILVADWFAYGIFGLYDYYPGLAEDHLVDSALGEFLAELVFVPGLVVTLLPRVSGLTSMLLGTAIVCALEIGMQATGIYSGSDWLVGMTAVGFAIYFAALHLFYGDLLRHTLPAQRLRMILRGVLVFDMIALLSLFLRAHQLVVTDIHLLPDRTGNNALGRLLTYGMVAAPLGYWALCGKGSSRWLRICAAMVALAALNFGMAMVGFQYMVPPWSITWDSLAQGAAYALAALAEDGILALRERESRRLA